MDRSPEKAGPPWGKQWLKKCHPSRKYPASANGEVLRLSLELSSFPFLPLFLNPLFLVCKVTYRVAEKIKGNNITWPALNNNIMTFCPEKLVMFFSFTFFFFLVSMVIVKLKKPYYLEGHVGSVGSLKYRPEITQRENILSTLRFSTSCWGGGSSCGNTTSRRSDKVDLAASVGSWQRCEWKNTLNFQGVSGERNDKQ